MSDISLDHAISVGVARLNAVGRLVNLGVKNGLGKRDYDFAA